jgi:hypothetical protein
MRGIQLLAGNIGAKGQQSIIKQYIDGQARPL